MCTKSQSTGKITKIRALSGRFSPNAQISGHTQIYPGELGTLYKGSSMNWRGASLRVVWLRLFCVDDEEIRILIGLTPVCTWQASQLQEKAWQLHHQQNWVQSPAVLLLQPTAAHQQEADIDFFSIFHFYQTQILMPLAPNGIQICNY